jgi:hypothetical protein
MLLSAPVFVAFECVTILHLLSANNVTLIQEHANIAVRGHIRNCLTL